MPFRVNPFSKPDVSLVAKAINLGTTEQRNPKDLRFT